MNRAEFTEALQDVRTFVGSEWLDSEAAAAGVTPDPMATHPLVHAWQQTSRHLEGHRVPGLDTTPRQQFMHLMMLAGHIKTVTACPVVDSQNRRLDVTVSELYRRRLQETSSYRSAIFELQIAGAHMRQGYSLSFIHDDSAKTPEFQIELADGRVFVECKRIEKRRLSRRTSAWLSQIEKRAIGLIRQSQKSVGIAFLLDQDEECGTRETTARVKQLLRCAGNEAEDRWPGYVLKKFPLPARVAVPVARQDRAMHYYYDRVLQPHLKGYLEGAEIVKEEFQPAVHVTPEGQVWEAERGFWAALKVLPNLISGIESSLKKASSQIPKGSVGVVYVEAPPYDATDEEIDEFRSAILSRLNATSRVLALVLTGTLWDVSRVEHFSNIIPNEACTAQLPAGFEVVQLQETYTCR